MKYGMGAVDLDARTLSARFEGFSDRASDAPPAEELIERALSELRESGFGDAVAGRHLGLLVADGTREPIFDRFLEGLEPELRSADRITAFVCTGTHDPELPENRAVARELRRALRGPGAEVVVHDARLGPFRDFGGTSGGTSVRVNAVFEDCRVLLTVSDMKNHYFAGYSNPVKYLVPGISAYETARANHSLTLEPESTFGRHPWHRLPERRSNPLAEDMVEAFELAVLERDHFAICTVGGLAGLSWAGAGPTRDVAARGMDVVDKVASLEVEPARFLVVSPGGHPHDESLYTAQRALELTRDAVLPGGEVLFLAQCANGIGSETAKKNFFEPLSRPLDEVRKRPEGEYVLYSHKSYKFGHYLGRLAGLHMLSDLSPEDVERIHLRPVSSAQGVLDEWAGRAEEGDTVTFIDDASRFAVRAG